MNFDLDEEQAEIRDTVRRFTESHITPYAETWDELNHFPREVYTLMAELGLMGMTTPEEYGGSALSRLSGALVYEELARGEMATSVGLSVQNMVAGSIARFGNAEQIQRWVTRLASGELLGAFSLSETASGSDAASLQCRAENQGNSYLLNGSKTWVTNGGEADVYLLMARTSAGKGASGISCFVIEKGTPGFSFGKTERKMGLHSSLSTASAMKARASKLPSLPWTAGVSILAQWPLASPRQPSTLPATMRESASNSAILSVHSRAFNLCSPTWP